MMRRILDNAAVFLVLLLSLVTLLFKIATDQFSLIIIGGDTIVTNLLVLFTCAVGVITWRENKHISLASLVDKIPNKIVITIIECVKSFAMPLVLTSLFFTAFSETFVVFAPENKILGIPLRVIFAVLPLSYLAMLVLACKEVKHLPFALLGIVSGLCIASGPIYGVLNSLFGTYPVFLESLFSIWCAFADFATAPLVILLIILAFLGVPLFVVISGISYLAFSQWDGNVETIAYEAYNILTDKTISAIPLFTITGFILSKGSAGNRLVEVFHSLFGWLRGGVVIATVIVVTFFTTFTGVSGITILALGSLLTIILTGSGYSEDKAQSLITASGSVGLLFPPSVAIIMYGTTNYFSVDVVQLFKGALIPGCLLALGMIVLGIVYDTNPNRAPFSASDAGKALKGALLELLLPIGICVGYFTGIFSLSESAAFALIYTIVLEVFIRRDFNFKTLISVIIESLPVSGGVLFILASARGLSYFLLAADIPALVSEFVLSVVSSKYVFLILLNLVLLVVGCLMDTYSAILIVSPLIIPIAESFGLSPVHTGVIFLMNMEIGFLTPPVGMNLFIASYAFNKPVFKVVRGILPFLLVQLAVLFLVTYIPWFSGVIP